MNDEKNNIETTKVIFLGVLSVIACIAVVFVVSRQIPKASFAEQSLEEKGTNLYMPIQQDKRYKILNLMSYHSPWKWTDDQFQGFKEFFSDVDVEYKVFQMDTKRQSSEQWKLNVAAQAKELIETWKPDLIFANDDNAQSYIVKDYVNTEIPFVFCAVNASPSDYGFTGSKNVTGVLERMHFVQSVRLLKELVPSVRKIAIVTDTGQMWISMMDRMKQLESELPENVEVTDYYVLETFEEYKQTVKECEGKVDALGMLGVFEFKDSNGANVSLEKVQSWTVENSRLPDFAFYKDRVDKGTLCAVTVSGLAQGQAAGRIARQILLEGRNPSDIPVNATEKGIPVINLARAEKLNIRPKSSVLLTAEVVIEISD